MLHLWLRSSLSCYLIITYMIKIGGRHVMEERLCKEWFSSVLKGSPGEQVWFFSTIVLIHLKWDALSSPQRTVLLLIWIMIPHQWQLILLLFPLLISISSSCDWSPKQSGPLNGWLKGSFRNNAGSPFSLRSTFDVMLVLCVRKWKVRKWSLFSLLTSCIWIYNVMDKIS